MEFATRYRGAGADGEEQYARAVATADVPGCPVCLEVPGVASSVQEQEGKKFVECKSCRANRNVQKDVEQQKYGNHPLPAVIVARVPVPRY